MTTNNPVNVNLSGQTGTANFVGSTAPTFTTSWAYAASGFAILDNNGNKQITFTTTASAVNYFTITNNSTGNTPTLGVTGSDTNVDMTFQTKGSGVFTFGSTLAKTFTIHTLASAVNTFSMQAATTGNGPTFETTGTDTDVPMNLETKGAGSFLFSNNDGGSNTNLFTLTPSSTPVNYLTVTSANTGVAPAISATGSDTNILTQLNGKGTSGVGVQGSSTNDNAVAGNVGEYKSTVVLSGSAVNLSSGNTVNVATLSLTAGDWDVWGELWPSGPSGTSITALSAQISTTSATGVTTPGDGTSLSQMPQQSAYVIGSHVLEVFSLAPCRISLSTTTNVFLGCSATFTVHVATAYGKIAARRVR